jgi:peptidoglycan hydrolase-like protein with peptidoglycan-binding domain
MRYAKRIAAIGLSLIMIVAVCIIGIPSASASGTGAGLADWAMNAYNSKWKYVYGGASAGAVDCSGLIYSYCGGARVGSAQLSSATASGSVSSGIPRIHGLGLYQPGHVGVYVGNGMAVDARNEYYGVCYQSTSTKSWTTWFKLAAVTYPTNGWVKFNGNYYYYENGQYVVSCTKTIGGESYTFASSGISNKTPSDLSAVANNSSKSTTKKSTSTKKTTTTTAKKSTTSSVLQLGSSGDKVTKLQKRLTKLGFYSGAITGYFGELTQSAYKAFQKAAGVTVDGICGKSDRKILYSSSAPKATQEKTEEKAEEKTEEKTEETTSQEEEKTSYQLGDSGDKVITIQEKLTELNYYNGELSGYYGDVTSNSIIAFQQANDLEATGICDEETYKALTSKSAVENPAFTTPTEAETTEATTETEAPTEAVTETPTEPEATETVETQAPTTSVSDSQELAQENAEVVQEVVVKTNKISQKALAQASDTTEKAKTLSIADKNTSFVLWLLVVVGIVLVAISISFVLNKRRNRYTGAHVRVKAKSNNDTTVRYW